MCSNGGAGGVWSGVGYSPSVPRFVATRFVPLCFVAVALSAPTGRLQAQECPTTDAGPLLSTPGNEARQVTVDAYVKVEYSPDYFVGIADPGQFVHLHETISDPGAIPNYQVGEQVPGSVSVVGDVVYYVPDEPLASLTRYVIVAESFEFEPKEFAFETGIQSDTSPPRLGAVRSPTTERVGPTCGRPSGYRVDVVVETIFDDGPLGSVELLVYLARQDGLEAPELILRERALGSGENTLGFVISDEQATQPACIVVHAVDGVGRVDDTMEPLCFEVIQGAFFSGLCSVAPRGYVGATSSGGGLVFFLLSLVAAWRLRRRCRCRS